MVETLILPRSPHAQTRESAETGQPASPSQSQVNRRQQHERENGGSPNTAMARGIPLPE